MRFSQRYGYTSVRQELQVEAMDEALRTGIWNQLLIDVFGELDDGQVLNRTTPVVKSVAYNLWVEYFAEPLNELPRYWVGFRDVLHRVIETASWYAVYDLVEITANYCDPHGLGKMLREGCNRVFEREGSAWRFVGNTIAPITSEPEIQSIEQVASLSGPLSPVSLHIQHALANLSDRQNPDYRTSIKESISAVEALGRLIVPSAQSVAQALNGFDKTPVELHPDLKEGLKKIYWWTCDHGGIRHALMDGSTVEFEDAMYMLVSCSAFINYLMAKAQRAGITF